MERCKDSFSWKVSSTIVSMLRGTKRCDSFFAQGRAGESTYRVYTALSREYRASSFLSSRAKLSPPWYLFNTDATPRQPLLSYRPTRNTCPRGVSLLPRSSRAMEKYSKIIIIFNPFLPPRFAFLVYHFSGYSFHEYERNIMEGKKSAGKDVFAKMVHGGLIQYRGGISRAISPAKIIEVANKLDEFHVKRWNSGGGLSMHE